MLRLRGCTSFSLVVVSGGCAQVAARGHSTETAALDAKHGLSGLGLPSVTAARELSSCGS